MAAAATAGADGLGAHCSMSSFCSLDTLVMIFVLIPTTIDLNGCGPTFRRNKKVECVPPSRFGYQRGIIKIVI